jgi:mono/diheme cytochrome c family protein
MAGYTALMNAPYVSCGIPMEAFRRVVTEVDPSDLLPGRVGPNADLPYAFTAHENADGVTVVASNCLTCHAARFEGEVIVGLGNEFADFTQDPRRTGPAIGQFRPRRGRDPRLGTLGRPGRRDRALHPDRHHRREPGDEPDLGADGPSRPRDADMVGRAADRPAAGRAAADQRAALVGDARQGGDVLHHHRARRSCELHAARLDALRRQRGGVSRPWTPMPIDIRAYIASLEAPAYPHEIDAERAPLGAAIYARGCATCHGGQGTGYPNLVVPLDEIGTDPAYAVAATDGSRDRFYDWIARSPYGDADSAAPARGYIAPPLDGIWATAPYLHNGSVPSLAALLSPQDRPRYWRHVLPRAYDREAVGWRSSARCRAGCGGRPGQRRRIYDTTRTGYGNGGHGFGADLSAEDRAALIEYLKTL